MAFSQLPAYNPGNALNFEPLNTAVNNWGQRRQQNALMGYQQERDQVADTRQNALMARQDRQEARAQTQFDDKRGQEALNELAGVYQSIEGSPEADRPALYQRFKPYYDRLRQRIPDFDADLQSLGVDPNDHTAMAPLVMGRAAGYQDPLSRRKTEAEIAKLEREATSGGKLSLQPVYGYDAEGNPVVMQASGAGELVQSKVPQGVTVDPALTAQRKAAGTERGKAEGVAQINLPLAENSAQRMIDQIDKVISDPGLDRITGTVYGRLPSWTNTSEEAKVAQSRVDQILGGTFLQAYNDLRGAGQISNAEGQAAKEAYNRLQSQAIGSPGYREALIEFKNQILTLRDITRQRANGSNRAQINVPAQGGGFKYLGPAD